MVLSRVLKTLSSARQSVSQAALYLSFFALLQKFLSVLQQILIGRLFGISADADAFFVAQAVPFMLGGMIAISLTTSLVPVVSRRPELRPGVLAGLALSLVGMLLSFSLLSLVLDSAVIGVLGYGLTEGTAATAERLFALMSSLFILMGSSGMLTAIFHAGSRFLVPAVAACLPYLGGIGGLFLLKPILGIGGLAWGLIIGAAGELLLLSLFVEREWLQRPVFQAQAWRDLLRTFVPVLVCTAVSTLYLVIDRSFATAFPTGYVSSFNFAGNLMTIPLQMVVTNIAVALFPSLVSLRARKIDFATLFGNALVWAVFLVVPGLVIVRTWSQPLVRLLFHSESFDMSAVNLTSTVLMAYSYALVGLTLKDMSSIALIALGRERWPMLIGVGSLALSILLKLALVPRFGYLAIAYSTDVACACNGLILLWFLSRLLGLDWRRLGYIAGKMLVAGAVMVAYWLLFRHIAAVDRGPSSWVYLVTSGGVYLLACVALRLPQPGLLWQRVASIGHRVWSGVRR